jgi:hypothetical protein
MASQRLGARVLLLLGVAWTVVFAVRLPWYLRARRSSEWPTTKGVVTRCGLREVSGRFGPGYVPEVEYEYVVGGRRLAGRRIAFRPNRYGGKRAEEIVGRYPVGAAVSVASDPSNVDEAVLVPGLDEERRLLFRMGVVCLIGGVVVSLGALGWLWSRRA